MAAIIPKMYHWLHRHDITLRLLVFLREHGMTQGINAFLWRMRDKKERAAPTQAMKESAAFFTKNRDRALNVLNLLADEKSKKVWAAAVRYRVDRTPIAPELYSESDQYFVKDILQISDGEVFIDGGAYTGDTIKQFASIAQKQKIQYKKIIAFEPGDQNYRLLTRFCGGEEKILLIKKGLSAQEETLYFKEAGVVSRVVEDEKESAYQVPVINIDAITDCKEATWIKMDIEGSEMRALQGACETIKKNRPKLTICIYHSNEDMIQIIEYIHSLVPEYQLYVRHHSRGAVDTVLYALI